MVPEREPTKRALLIGINYEKNINAKADGPHAPLCVPHRDVTELRQLLIDLYDYQAENIVVMMDGVDTDPLLEPNGENILREIQNLVKDAQPGDHFLFHYSGHSGQIINEDDTEEDGLDEVLIPSDDKEFDKIITDDQLRKYLVDALPIGSNLVAIIDCCHSASMLDLEHYRCNRVYTPWVFNGGRRWSDVKRAGVVRRLALVSPRGPSLHIYENHRVDGETVELKKMSLDILTDSAQVFITRRTSTLVSGEHVSRSTDFSDSSSDDLFHDALESPMSGSPPLPPSPSHSNPPTDSLSDSPILMCLSPVQDYCSGFCEPSSAEKPHIVCVAACKDSQMSWESDGRSMTMGMIGYLRQHPRPQLEDLLKYISHYVYNLAVERHQVARHLKRKLKTSNDPDERAAWSAITASGFDIEQFQDPQVSSLDPLDMQAVFTL